MLASGPVPAASRPFPLEGQKDVFQALGRRQVEGGPLCPSLATQLRPALKALNQTVKALGSEPTPWEVDASNLRRLVRASLSVLEAHRDSFSEQDYRRGTRELRKLASAVGRYKDAGILEDTVRSQFPEGKLPGKIEKALERETSRRAAAFEQSWEHFRGPGIKRVKKAFAHPAGIEGTPASLRREDEQRNRNHVAVLLDRLQEKGLRHECPDAFHEGRKALRQLVHACLAAHGTVPLAEDDLARMAAVIEGLGVAQDSHIAATWLERRGFPAEAAVAWARYQELHQAELQGVDELLAAGSLERLRRAVQATPSSGSLAPAPGKAVCATPLVTQVL